MKFCCKQSVLNRLLFVWQSKVQQIRNFSRNDLSLICIRLDRAKKTVRENMTSSFFNIHFTRKKLKILRPPPFSVKSRYRGKWVSLSIYLNVTMFRNYAFILTCMLRWNEKLSLRSIQILFHRDFRDILEEHGEMGAPARGPIYSFLTGC